MEDLMPCPFCGFEEPEYKNCVVTCPNCGATGPTDADAWGAESDQTHLTRELWDRRALRPTPNATLTGGKNRQEQGHA